jgi:hypothetical protein
VSGEPGTEKEIGVLLPSESGVLSVTTNGIATQFVRRGRYIGIRARFDGTRFAQAHEIALTPNAGETLAGSFAIPRRVFDQLSERQKKWPIPWTSEDYKTTWLAPERLLLFLQLAAPSDAINPPIAIDGQAIELQKAYSSVRVHADSFVGFYADVSAIAPDVPHWITLKLPVLKAGQFQGLFFDNVEPQFTESVVAPSKTSHSAHH